MNDHEYSRNITSRRKINNILCDEFYWATIVMSGMKLVALQQNMLSNIYFSLLRVDESKNVFHEEKTKN